MRALSAPEVSQLDSLLDIFYNPKNTCAYDIGRRARDTNVRDTRPSIGTTLRVVATE